MKLRHGVIHGDAEMLEILGKVECVMPMSKKYGIECEPTLSASG